MRTIANQNFSTIAFSQLEEEPLEAKQKKKAQSGYNPNRDFQKSIDTEIYPQAVQLFSLICSNQANPICHAKSKWEVCMLTTGLVVLTSHIIQNKVSYQQEVHLKKYIPSSYNIKNLIQQMQSNKKKGKTSRPHCVKKGQIYRESRNKNYFLTKTFCNLLFDKTGELADLIEENTIPLSKIKHQSLLKKMTYIANIISETCQYLIGKAEII